MDRDLRPLGIAELLDAGIKLYLRHWRTLVLSVVWLVVPVQVVTAVVTTSLAPDSLAFPASDADLTADEEADLLTAQAVIVVLSLIAGLLATALCFRAVADAYAGIAPDWRRSLRYAARRLGGLVGVALTFVAVVLLGLFALIIPGVWLAVALSVAVPALLLERLAPMPSLGRSFALVSGRWWATFGTLLVGYLLVGIAGAVIGGTVVLLAGLAGDSTAVDVTGAAIGGTIGSVITTPYAAVVVTLVYFDLRVRKEGLDLARILGEDEPAAPLEPAAPAEGLPTPSGWLPPRPADRDGPS